MFVKGQTVRVLFNPYGDMIPSIKPGDVGTITSGGRAIVGVKFGKVRAKCWPAELNGQATIESAQPVRYVGYGCLMMQR